MLYKTEGFYKKKGGKGGLFQAQITYLGGIEVGDEADHLTSGNQKLQIDWLKLHSSERLKLQLD